MEKLSVIVEVSGGVAYVTKCPAEVTVQIIDHDNEEETYPFPSRSRFSEGEC